MSNKAPVRFLTDKLWFPDANNTNEDGLLAVGGDLSPERILLAYQKGIFPWFSDDDLILWWSPTKRMVLFRDQVHISKTMRQILKNHQFRLTINQNFEEVITQCAKINRQGQNGTWITPKMIESYLELHRAGHAISYEVWREKDLVGGLYGLKLGHVFSGESMYHLVNNASKFAFIKLAQNMAKDNIALIDCQLHNEHLASLGAQEISREAYLKILTQSPD